MSQGVEHQIHNVLVGEHVNDLFSTPPALDDVLIAKHSEALADGRYCLAFCFGQLRYGDFSLRQKRQKAESRDLADCLE